MSTSNEIKSGHGHTDQPEMEKTSALTATTNAGRCDLSTSVTTDPKSTEVPSSTTQVMFPLQQLPTELQIEIIKQHLWPSRVLAVHGHVSVSEEQTSAEDFGFLGDLWDLYEKRDTMKTILFSISPHCNPIYLGIKKIQELAEMATMQTDVKQMILQNPNAFFYIDNFDRVITLMNIEKDLKSMRMTPVKWEVSVTNHIACNISHLKPERIVHGDGSISSFAAFFVRFPQIESLSLVLGDSPEKVHSKDSFIKGVYGFISQTGTALAIVPNYDQPFNEYLEGGKTITLLRKCMWEHEIYRMGVNTGSRRELIIKMVRWD